MNNEIKEILENIKCPQLGYDEYGKWGALPLNVRMTLKRLCDYVVSCDDYITNLQQIEQEHKKINGELRERIAYLERSNDRREDTILGLRQEINDVEDKNSKLEIALQQIQELTNNWNELEEWIKEQKEDANKCIEWNKNKNQYYDEYKRVL